MASNVKLRQREKRPPAIALAGDVGRLELPEDFTDADRKFRAAIAARHASGWRDVSPIVIEAALEKLRDFALRRDKKD